MFAKQTLARKFSRERLLFYMIFSARIYTGKFASKFTP